MLARVDWEAEARRGRLKFLSVTYPADFPTARQSKAHLEAFRRVLERKFPELWGVWRLEEQRRGAPHYHFLLGGVSWVSLWWLRKVWGRIIGYRGSERLQVDVRQVRSARHARAYVSKYVAKVEAAEAAAEGQPQADPAAAAVLLEPITYPDGLREGWASPGRFWGWIRRELVPWAERVVFSLPIGEWFWRVKRVMRRAWRGVNGQRHRGAMVFGSVETWGRVLGWALNASW